MKLIALLKRDFQRPGETLTEFAKEVRLLTDIDRADFVRWYTAEGEEVEEAKG